MKINCISNRSFGQIFISDKYYKNIAINLMKNYSYSDLQKISNKVKIITNSKNTDIYITNEGEMFVKNNLTGDKTYIAGDVDIAKKYNVALNHAIRMEDKYEY